MSDRNIKEAIEKLSNQERVDNVHVEACTVESVNIGDRTCEVSTISGKTALSISGVQLMASVDDGLLIIPEIGSIVFVQYSTYQLPFILMYSSISSIKLLDGIHGGLVKVIELTSKLNSLENKVNDIILKYNAHVHTANGTPTVSQVVGAIIPTQRPEIENNKITHGN